jgi:hypothetical protein
MTLKNTIRNVVFSTAALSKTLYFVAFIPRVSIILVILSVIISSVYIKPIIHSAY